MAQQNIPLEGINKKSRIPVIYIIVGILLFGKTFAQRSDSLSQQKKIDFVLGVKLFFTNASPDPRMASIIGADAYFFKNRNASISYRNFFSIGVTPRDTVFNKNIRFLSTSNSISFCYKVNLKKDNYVKFGLGPYHSREQTFVDQYYILSNPHEYGIEFSVYTKLKWLNIGYRHQIQLADYESTHLSIQEIYRYSLCIEVPIHLK